MYDTCHTDDDTWLDDNVGYMLWFILNVKI